MVLALNNTVKNDVHLSIQHISTKVPCQFELDCSGHLPHVLRVPATTNDHRGHNVSLPRSASGFEMKFDLRLRQWHRSCLCRGSHGGSGTVLLVPCYDTFGQLLAWCFLGSFQLCNCSRNASWTASCCNCSSTWSIIVSHLSSNSQLVSRSLNFTHLLELVFPTRFAPDYIEHILQLVGSSL